MEEHIRAIGVTDLRGVSKGIFKRKVTKYFRLKQREELLEDIKNYKKMNYEELKDESFERKPFLHSLNLENARMKYKLLSKSVSTVRSHFPQKYRRTSLACPACLRAQTNGPPASLTTSASSSPVEDIPRDTTDHILLACPEYEDLKDDAFDPSDDTQLTEFFVRVVKRRIDKGDN